MSAVRVKLVEVTGLFGLYSHSVNLALRDRVTILHGPNGVGKTMLFRLLAALFDGRPWDLVRAPFAELTVRFTDDRYVSVAQRNGPSDRLPSVEDESDPFDIYLRLTVGDPDSKPRVQDIGPFTREAAVVSAILARVPWLEGIGGDRWLDTRAEAVIDTSTALDRYADYATPTRKAPRKTSATSLPDWFMNACKLPRIQFIEAQRLFRIGGRDKRQGGRGFPFAYSSPMVPAVSDCAQDLQRRIRDALADYARTSQELDQSFPQRLLRPDTSPLPLPLIKEKLASLTGQSDRLREIGLLETPPDPPLDPAELDAMDETQHKAISLFVEDGERKLLVFDALARRVEVLQETVNSKLSNKSIRVGRDQGLLALGHDSTPLELDSLSSGEQHELVLLYDLLFKVESGTLVLIDEPELSLHVVWQKRFLSDLLAIADLARLDALVATHSPFIVADRDDLMVALDAKSQ